MKTTLKTKSAVELARAATNMLAGHIIRWEQQFNDLAATAGKTPQEMREKIADLIDGLTGAEVACLHLRLKIAYEKAEEKERWGFTDTEIDWAIDAARKRMERLQARERA